MLSDLLPFCCVLSFSLLLTVYLVRPDNSTTLHPKHSHCFLDLPRPSALCSWVRSFAPCRLGCVSHTANLCAWAIYSFICLFSVFLRSWNGCCCACATTVTLFPSSIVQNAKHQLHYHHPLHLHVIIYFGRQIQPRLLHWGSSKARKGSLRLHWCSGWTRPCS